LVCEVFLKNRELPLLNDPPAFVKAFSLNIRWRDFENRRLRRVSMALYNPIIGECNVKITRQTENFSNWGKFFDSQLERCLFLVTRTVRAFPPN
jgi:hypothetical protein